MKTIDPQNAATELTTTVTSNANNPNKFKSTTETLKQHIWSNKNPKQKQSQFNLREKTMIKWQIEVTCSLIESIG